MENLKKVDQASDHLLNLINEVLDLSKIEAGHMDVEDAEFDIRQVVQTCYDSVSTDTLIQPGVQLLADIPDDLGTAHTDATRLRQIVINLLSNALKFTEEGSATLRVSKNGPVDEEAMLEIAVIDTGKGIPEDALSTIFEEFGQVKGTQGGTGLGLPISRGWAELMGGTIGVESEAGKGSTFTVRVPVVYKEG